MWPVIGRERHFSWVDLESRLSNSNKGPTEGQQAAVALLLRMHTESLWPEILLMRRAVREGDRWSGQISLPGGHVEPADQSLLATAIRETREEVGANLSQVGQYLGRLAAVKATPAGPRGLTTVHPFVFRQCVESQFALSDEADRVFWLPLSSVLDESLASTHSIVHKGKALDMPSWNFEEEVIWGLTYRIIRSLLALFV